MTLIAGTDIQELLSNKIEGIASSDPDGQRTLHHQSVIAQTAAMVGNIDLNTSIQPQTTTGLFNASVADSVNSVQAAIAQNAPEPSLNPDQKFQQGLDQDEVNPNTLAV